MAMNATIYTFEGEDATVTWSKVRCLHAEVCVHGLPGVFDSQRRPWIEPDRAQSAEDLAAVVFNCPTGALHITSGPEEPIPDSNTVTLAPNGPLYVRGDVTVADADGETVIADTRVALCRCGLSQHKPFCDNSHLGTFRDAGTMGDTAPLKNTGAQAGGLCITLAPNGPLLVEGPLTCTGADGTSASGAQTALCRCGASANKPFCDGSHREIGFETP